MNIKKQQQLQRCSNQYDHVWSVLRVVLLLELFVILSCMGYTVSAFHALSSLRISSYCSIPNDWIRNHCSTIEYRIQQPPPQNQQQRRQVQLHVTGRSKLTEIMVQTPSQKVSSLLPYITSTAQLQQVVLPNITSIKSHIIGDTKSNVQTSLTTTPDVPPLPTLQYDNIDQQQQSILPLWLDNMKTFLIPTALLILTGIINYYCTTTMGYNIFDTVHDFMNEPQVFIGHTISNIETMGPMGMIYFSIFYIVAEILALPAIPFTISAGYLFGIPMGVTIVLVSATIAASISFFIGKTILRNFVITNLLQSNPKYQKIDTLIGQRGFTLLLLLRLSPIFPFALSNYIYGASSIDFISYFWATLIGFAPGTIAYVYTGMVGKEVMFNMNNNDNGTILNDQPWYIYAIGFTIILGFMKIISDTATGIIESMDDDDNDNNNDKNNDINTIP